MATGYSATAAGIGNDGAKTVTSNYDLLTELFAAVDDDGSVDITDVPAFVRERFTSGRKDTILEREYHEDGSISYSIDQRYIEYHDQHQPRGAQMPCGHHGFRNLDGELFACPHDWCDARFNRSKLEEALLANRLGEA